MAEKRDFKIVVLMSEEQEHKDRVDSVVDTFSKGVFYQISSFGISKSFGIVFTIIMLNYFVAEESDLFFTANAFVQTIAAFAGLGLSVAAIKFLPGMILRKEGSKIKTEVYSAVVLLALMMVVVFGVFIVLSPYVAEAQAILSSSIGIVGFAFILSFLLLENTYIVATLNAFKQFFTTSLVNVAIQVLRVLVAGVLIYFGAARAFEMLGGYMLSYLVVTVYLAYIAWGKISKLHGEGKIDFYSLRRSIRFGLPLYLGGIIDTFLTQMDVILIAYFLGGNPGVVSGYVAVVLIVRNIAPMIIAPIITVQQPMLVEEHERKSKLFLNMIRETSRWAVYLGLPVLLVFLAFDVAFMQLIAGDYVENSVLIWLFAPLVISTLFGVSHRNSLMVKEYVMALFTISLIVITINFGLDWWFIPTIGLAGAAIGSSIASATGDLIAIIYAKKKIGAQLHTDTLKGVVAFLGSLGLAYVYLPIIGQLSIFSRGGILELIFSMLVVCCAYVLILVLLKGFTKRDFDMTLEVLDKNKLLWVRNIAQPIFGVLERYTG